MRFWIDVYDANGDLVGDGPINGATRCTIKKRVSRVGEFSFEMPATDERASYVVARRTALIYAMLEGEKTYLGGGAIDNIVTRISGNGIAMLQVSGSDLLTELTRISVGKLDLSDTGDNNIDDLLTIVSSAPLSWATSRESGSPEFIARLVYETVFNSLFSIAEKTGAYFRMDGAILPTRTLEWFYTIEDSGILATMHGDPVAIESNPNVCLITDIEIDQDSNDLKTRAYLFGAGEGESVITALYAQNWPNLNPISLFPDYTVNGQDYSFNRADNYVVNDTAEALYGRDEIALAFKDIMPIFNTPSDLVATSNFLLVAAIEYLDKNYKPFVSYKLSVAGLRSTLKPGQSILVQARRFRDGEKPIDINENLFVLEVETSIDTDGVQTTGLTVSNMNRWPVNDYETIARELAKTTVMSAHPQTGPNVDTIPYREHVDDTHNATLHFWLGEETTTVQSVFVRFRVDPLRSTVAGGASTSSGPSSAATSAASNHTTSDNTASAVVNHGHWIEFNESAASPGFPVRYDPAAGGTLYVINGGSGSQSGGNTGLTDLSAHTHEMPHDHNIPHTHTFVPLLLYGVYDDPGTVYTATDLEWKTEADVSWTPITGGDAISGASGWYGINITPNIVTDFRPTTAVNNVQFRVKAASHAGKAAQLTVQIERRTSIQSIAVF